MAGCSDPGYSASTRYELAPHTVLEGTDTVKTYTLTEARAEALEGMLLGTFGTPRDPLVQAEDAAIETLRLDGRTLALGSKLFRAQCLTCHGKEGDGRGKSAALLNPTPRDFRQGKFKFVSTVRKDSSGKPDTGLAAYPARSDLYRTIETGLPGAGMTAFQQKPEQIEALVSYVIHLSLRGQVEYRLMRQWLEEDEQPRPTDVGRELRMILQQWAADSQSIYAPQVPWEEVESEGEKTNWARGRELFLTKGGCTDCHGKSGKALPEEVPTIAQMKDDWGHPIRPRNFTEDPFRGGGRPIDLFYRARLGIKPSRMQASDTTKLSDEEIWQLVGYVRSLRGKP